MRRTGIFGVIILCCFFQTLSAQSGKLAGQVADENGEPVIAANVVLVGTTLGAAADVEGYYAVLNVRPGRYNVRYSAIGYQTKVVENVHVAADQTTKIDITLHTQTVEMGEVVITAERPLVEFNQTSSVATVTQEDIQRLPVQNLNEIVNLQAGIVSSANGDLHFRGGRKGEVQFQVDGVTVNNPYNNASSLKLDRSVLEQVQVISGTFDAKYGQAMSGVVNAILRSGSDRLEWSGEAYGGDYYTSDNTRYPHDQDFSPSEIQSYQLTLSGPTPLRNTTFLISGRRFLNDGWLFGDRRFLPTDKNNFETREFNPSGDSKVVPMAYDKEWSGQLKLSNHSIPNIQISYQAILNDIDRKIFDRGQNTFRFRLIPDATKTQNTFSITHGLDWTHALSENMFYKISARQNYFDFSDYVFKDVFDPRYLVAGEPKSDPNFEDGAVVQGVDLSRFIQTTNAGILKGDFTWQANRMNLIETGLETQVFNLKFGAPGFLRATFDPATGQQRLRPILDSDDPKDPRIETHHPRQAAAYLQDRIEWGDIVVRAGLRFEYFDANATIPSDLQNPANSIAGAPQSVLKKTSTKTAWAPRLGFSFPITSSASVYFSYGHFRQIPELGQMFNNANYAVLEDLQQGGVEFGVLGNPDLEPEFTVQYEFGLKQALNDFLGLELSFFYKDIRDLLGVEFISTYAAADYARFTNVDFGSVYGYTISLDQRAIGPISTTLDYTLQYAQGNASDPRETANRAQAGKDARPRDVPLDWDQRHTLNATAILADPGNYSVSTIIKFGSGQPFTPEIGTGFGADLERNSGRKSSFLLVDLRAEKFFTLPAVKLSLFARVFNLFNEHFVNGFVFANSGSPDFTLFPEARRAELKDPSRFHEPRRIEFGISFRSR